MTTGTNEEAYALRIEAVVGFICSHLQEELSVDRLSEVAGFSKFHFHRQFTAYAGVPVAQFVRLTRLKRAAYQLAFDPRRSVIEIALDAGFSAPESFSRAFKDAQGQSPSEFRRAPEWGAWRRDQALPTPIRSNSSVVEKIIPAGRCAVARHIGSTDAIGTTVHSLYAEWLPKSGEKLRDFPCFFHYIERMPKVAEHEQITDVYLPLL